MLGTTANKSEKTIQDQEDNFGRDFGDLLGAAGDNIFLFKINYRFEF
ncbi:MAG: hypothetical protein V3R45_00010 [Candidatus Aminicenantaceae bacterium]